MHSKARTEAIRVILRQERGKEGIGISYQAVHDVVTVHRRFLMVKGRKRHISRLSGYTQMDCNSNASPIRISTLPKSSRYTSCSILLRGVTKGFGGAGQKHYPYSGHF